MWVCVRMTPAQIDAIEMGEVETEEEHEARMNSWELADR